MTVKRAFWFLSFIMAVLVVVLAIDVATYTHHEECLMDGTQVYMHYSYLEGWNAHILW